MSSLPLAYYGVGAVCLQILAVAIAIYVVPSFSISNGFYWALIFGTIIPLFASIIASIGLIFMNRRVQGQLEEAVRECNNKAIARLKS